MAISSWRTQAIFHDNPEEYFLPFGNTSEKSGIPLILRQHPKTPRLHNPRTPSLQDSITPVSLIYLKLNQPPIQTPARESLFPGRLQPDERDELFFAEVDKDGRAFAVLFKKIT